MRHPVFALALALSLFPALQAGAADPARLQNEAVRLELVMDAPPAPGEPLRGALLVDLQPGWTTYWRDPGEAGLAPALAFADGSGAPLAVRWSQPAPRRLAEGKLFVNAYEGRTAFALTFDAAPAGGHVSLDLLIGVCREICVPVSARLEAPVEPEPPLADRRAVRAAFAALPEPAASGALAVLPPDAGGEALRVASTVPAGDAPAELFVAAAPGWRFGPSRREDAPDAEGRAVFAVPVTARPAGAPENAFPERIDIVLASGDKAVAASGLPTR